MAALVPAQTLIQMTNICCRKISAQRKFVKCILVFIFIFYLIAVGGYAEGLLLAVCGYSSICGRLSFKISMVLGKIRF